MVEYGCVVKNKFFLLSDDEGADPAEILAKSSQIKKEKIIKPAAVPAQTTTAKPERTFANKENETNRKPKSKENRDQSRREGGEHDHPRREGGERGRGRGRGFGGERRPRPRQTDGDVVEVDRERGETDRPFRGGRGNRGGFGRRGRSDRKSGNDVSGVRAHDKKTGYGKGNWGTEKDELKGETEPIPDVEEKPVENEASEGDEEKPKEEEKPAGITLSEWKKMHEQDFAQNFNVRKPNIDKKLNLIPVKRQENEDKQDDEYVVIHRESKKKTIDIPVKFTSENARSYGNRGDRRGGRGGRGSRRGQSFHLTNEAFPAL